MRAKGAAQFKSSRLRPAQDLRIRLTFLGDGAKLQTWLSCTLSSCNELATEGAELAGGARKQRAVDFGGESR
jgi:hypothetical protein